MPLSQALRKLTKAILLTILTPRPLPQPVPPQFRMDLHYAYHQGSGHEIDRCIALRHAIQDLIDQGLVHLGQPSVTTNPLPSHTTHAVPPPADSMHSIDFAELDDQIHMMSWNESKLEPIVSDEIYEISRVTLGSRIPTPFRLVLEAASVQTTTVVPLTVSYYSAQTSFVLIPDVEEVLTPYVDDVHIPDIQYVIRGGRVVRQQPLTTARPLEGTSSHEEARREDDEILRQATCIVFSNDDVPPEGSDHTPPLYIFVGCSGRRIPYVLLDNGSTLNVYPLATAIAIGYVPSDFSPSIHIVRAYDNTQREYGSTVVLDMMRSKSYLPGMGLGRCQHGPIWWNYFMRASGPHMPSDGIIGGLSTIQEAELQRLVYQLQLSDEAPDTLASTLVVPSSPDRMNLITLYFPDEIDKHEIFAEIGDIVDGAVPHDEYIDEMLVMSMSQI
uniref:Retrotransposon gag domain-containing protein n=1 Tax=Vitis vinifera TaxID=29760 RepID=A5AIF9_VITVI|nr:hypothetical protein VITISV_006052 [Vitis vinifera]